jgi:DNA sulfur modification protein DndD
MVMIRNSIETTRKSIEDINEQIGGSERADLSKLEAIRQGVEGRIVRVMAERLMVGGEIVERELECGQRKARREQLQRVEGQKTELAERVELALRTYEALDQVKQEFTGEVKTRLSHDASEVFGRLLDEEGRSMLRKIVVQDDYSLQVLDPWGKPFLANISAGQRQVASIAFILALASAAAGGEVLEMPLFMDTPFGKLSWQHRENLISLIPGAATQWVLLATDTELGRREASLLSRGGAWGKFHVLESQPDGSTRVREHSVSEALSLLRNSEEDS